MDLKKHLQEACHLSTAKQNGTWHFLRKVHHCNSLNRKVSQSTWTRNPDSNFMSRLYFEIQGPGQPLPGSGINWVLFVNSLRQGRWWELVRKWKTGFTSTGWNGNISLAIGRTGPHHCSKCKQILFPLPGQALTTPRPMYADARYAKQVVKYSLHWTCTGCD